MGNESGKTTWRGILVAPPPHSEQAGALADSPYCAPASVQYQALKTLKKKFKKRKRKNWQLEPISCWAKMLEIIIWKLTKKKYVPVHSINYS